MENKTRDDLEKYMGVSISNEEYRKAFDIACEKLSNMCPKNEYTPFKTKKKVEMVFRPTPIMWAAHLVELAKEEDNGN